MNLQALIHTAQAMVGLSAQLLLIGAEFTWVYANRFGSRKPHTAAIPVAVRR